MNNYIKGIIRSGTLLFSFCFTIISAQDLLIFGGSGQRMEISKSAESCKPAKPANNADEILRRALLRMTDG